MEAKPIRMSRTVMTQIIFPGDTNYFGTMFGGKVMEYIDKIAAIAAMRHARKAVVTASSDSLDFLAPVTVGEIIELEAFVTWTHRSSMEVYVKVQSENLLTGEKKTTATSYLTLVAMEDGRPSQVPQVIPETDEEIRIHQGAAERHEQRKKRKEERRRAAEL